MHTFHDVDIYINAKPVAEEATNKKHVNVWHPTWLGVQKSRRCTGKFPFTTKILPFPSRTRSGSTLSAYGDELRASMEPAGLLRPALTHGLHSVC